MADDDGKYNYITPEHEHRSGEIGRDVYTTDRQSTLNNDTARRTGLPRAKDIGTKDHLVKDRDY